MRFPFLLLLVLLALATGCAGSLPRVLCAEQGGPPWHELKSPHFRVRSHLELKDSKRIVRELEVQRRILRRYWDDAFDPPGETEVLLVRDRSTLDEFSGGGGQPSFTQFTERGAWLVLSGNSAASYPLDKGAPPDSPSIIRHELAHLLSRYLLLRQPRWLAEGLATYLETASIQKRSGQVIFGGTYADTYETLGRNLLPDPELLWGWDDLPLHAASRAYRVTAWAWVHFLLNDHPQRFADFQARLARAEEPRYAWEAAFEGVGDLKEPFSGYLWRTELSTHTVPLPPLPTEEPTVRELGCAEVFALRSRLHLEVPGRASLEERVDAALGEMEEALRRDPTNLDAAVLKARIAPEPSQRLALARELVRAHPESGRTWALLGRALQETRAPRAEWTEAFQHVERLAPEEADVLAALAGFYADAGFEDRALATALRAAQRAPGSPVVLDTSAAVLDQLHRCPDRVVMQSRALDMLGEGSPQVLRLDYARRLARYQRECRGSQPTTNGR
jgi:tetratricopeptide (TPR) repeat protein